MEKKKRSIAPLVFLRNTVNGDMLFYGGIEFVYWSATVSYAFISAYLVECGFVSTTVGIIMALLNLVGILGSTVVGNICDKTGSTRKPYLVCLLLSVALYTFIPMFLPAKFLGVSLGVVLILTWSFTSRPMQGMTESIVVAAANEKKTFTFGAVRYFGSASYAIVCFIFGLIAKRLGSQEFSFYAYGILSIPLFLLIWKTKDAPAVQKKKGKKVGFKGAIGNYYLVMFLFCHCLMILPQCCVYTFLPYTLNDLQGTTAALGSLQAVRATMEIPLLMFGSRLVRKLGIKKFFYVCMGLFLLSQFFLIFASSMWMVYVAMICMGAAYGGELLGQVNYVYRITPPDAVASAQSLAVSFAMIASMASNLAGGVIVRFLSTSGLYTATLGVELFAVLLFTLTYPIGRMLKKPEPDLSNIM